MSTRAASRGRVSASQAVTATNTKRVAGGLALLAAGVGVARWMLSRSQTTRDRAPRNRWIMVTINCSPQRLASRADLPEPITRLGDAVDIKIAPAPGDRGTELGARLRDLPRTKIAGMVTRRPEEDPRRMVEEALRQAKSIIEAGEVLRPEWPPSAQPAQGAKLLEFAGRRGGRP
jgi:ferredoxin-NADP reductase